MSEGSLELCHICSAPVAGLTPFCSKCGSRRRLKRDASALHGVQARRPSVALEVAPTPILVTPTPTKSPARPVTPLRALSREATLASIEPASALTLASLQASMATLAARVQSLEETLQDEIRQRYCAEVFLQRLAEDVMRLQGVNVTSEEVSQRVRLATNFLDTLAERWKIDFDDVDFGDCIGSGGFSEVYEGTYLKKDVAIKKLRVNLFAGEDGADTYMLELEKEIQLLAELEHPNILRFVGVTLWPAHYIFTELMRDGDLDKFLRSGIPFEWTDRLDVVTQVAHGLHYLAHLVPPVCHLDLKPMNVLLTIGQKFHAVISDFGLSVRKATVMRSTVAERALQFHAMRKITQSGAIPMFAPALRDAVGTPLHAAPEIVRKQPFNERADIYSFAMLFWCTLTRSRLNDGHGGAGDLSVIYRPEMPQWAPPRVAALIKDCWAELPLDRPDISMVCMELDSIARAKLPPFLPN